MKKICKLSNYKTRNRRQLLLLTCFNSCFSSELLILLLPFSSSSALSAVSAFTFAKSHVRLCDIYVFGALLFFADVIHTVGPMARGHISDTHKEDLANCYKSSLKLAKENLIRSIVSTLQPSLLVDCPLGVESSSLLRILEQSLLHLGEAISEGQSNMGN